MDLLSKLGIGTVLLTGLWLWHSHAVSAAYREGAAVVQGRWDAETKRARAVAAAETLRRLTDEAARKARNLTISQEYEDALKSLQSRIDDRDARLRRLLNAAAPSSRPPTPLDPGAACPDHEERVRDYRRLLEEGVREVAETGRLVGVGADLTGSLGAKVIALQFYINDVVKPNASAR